jgi:DUF4097 and DUF4098 domain-containing protein YvlB
MTFAVLISLLASAPAAATGARTWREQTEKVVPGKGLKAVAVENARGSVTVRRSVDAELHLTALKIVRVQDEKDAREFSRRTEVVTMNEDGRFTVQVRYPQRQSISIGFWEMLRGFELPRVEVRVALEVPEGVPVTVESTSGDLVSEGLTSSQILETTSGDVRINDAHGRVEVASTSGDVIGFRLAAARLRTVSGDLQIQGATGPLNASTTSGDISVHEAEDSLALATVSGDVRVAKALRGLYVRSTSGDIVADAAAGSVRLETSSGSVRVGLQDPLHRAEISSGSGDIVARLAKSLRCALDLQTSSGTLDVSVPLEVRSVSRHELSGTVRAGSALIRLKSSSGDIDVKTGGDEL